MSEGGPSIEYRLGLLAFFLAVAVVTIGVIAPIGVTSADSSQGANLTAYRADSGSFTHAESIERAIENGTLEPAQQFVVGEPIVVKIESAQLARNLSSGNGSATHRFFDHIDGPATFRMIQINPSPQRSRLIGGFGPDNVTIDWAGSTVYAVIDSGELSFIRGGSQRGEDLFGGERFGIEFGYHLDGFPLGRPYDARGAVVELYPTKGEFTSISYQYDVLAPEWTHRSVEVNLRPDRSVFVRVSIHETGRTFTTPSSPDVYPDFTDIWIDLREVDPGTGVTLELVHDGRVIDREIGRIRQPRATLSNVTMVTRRNQSHVNVNATLTHGGKIQVLREGCEEVGLERVEPGGSRLVSVDLWTDRGERIHIENASDYGFTVRSLREDGAPRAEYLHGDSSKMVNWVGPQCGYPSRQPTPTVPPTATTTDQMPTDRSITTPKVTPSPDQMESETTAPISDTRSATSPGQPGFTAWMAIIVLAILGVVVYQKRR